MAATAASRKDGRRAATAEQWITTWGQALFRMPDAFGEHRIPAGTLTIRLPLGVGGDGCRIALSNRYGRDAVRVNSVELVSGDGPALRFTFGSAHTVVLPAGGSLVSDPLTVLMAAGGTALLTLHLLEPLELTSVNRIETDAWTAAAHGVPPAQGVRPRFWFADAEQLSPLPLLSAFDIRISGCPEEGAPGAILAFGDSITTGGWPARLSENSGAAAGDRSRVVVNGGISGNRLLRPGAGAAGSWFGDAGVARLREMLTAISGLGELIVLIGVNDILHPGVVAPATEEVRAADLIAGYRELVSIARSSGVATRLCTVLPFGEAEGASDAREQVRRKVNDWIRETSGFIDTAAALADPRDSSRLRADLDSGDRLHPNEAGQRELAEAVRRALGAD